MLAPLRAPLGTRMHHSVACCGWGPSAGGGPFRTSPRAHSLQAWQGEQRASSQTGARPLQAPV
eukprot:5216790-Lingulodinium_polyedra.AAC.1